MSVFVINYSQCFAFSSINESKKEDCFYFSLFLAVIVLYVWKNIVKV